jgi:hypothetical protein
MFQKNDSWDYSKKTNVDSTKQMVQVVVMVYKGGTRGIGVERKLFAWEKEMK